MWGWDELLRRTLVELASYVRLGRWLEKRLAAAVIAALACAIAHTAVQSP
jgi:hypothetical protein